MGAKKRKEGENNLNEELAINASNASLKLLLKLRKTIEEVHNLKNEFNLQLDRLSKLEDDFKNTLKKNKEEEFFERLEQTGKKNREERWREMMKCARDKALMDGLDHVPIPYNEIVDRSDFNRWFWDKTHRTVWDGKIGHKTSPSGIASRETVFPPTDEPQNITDFDE